MALAIKVLAGVVVLVVAILVLWVQYEEMDAKYRSRGGR